MPTPPSDRFWALSLDGAFNAERAALPDSLTPRGGVVSVDRYSAYKRLAKDTELVLSFCWVHVRARLHHDSPRTGRSGGVGRAVAG